jgi:hypothetical protein
MNIQEPPNFHILKSLAARRSKPCNQPEMQNGEPKMQKTTPTNLAPCVVQQSNTEGNYGFHSHNEETLNDRSGPGSYGD